MPRAKTGTVRRAKHRKVLKQAKGYWGLRSKSFKVAQQTLLNAADYEYRDRRDKKGDFRRLWIARINAATRQHGLSYSRFVHGLREGPWSFWNPDGSLERRSGLYAGGKWVGE